MQISNAKLPTFCIDIRRLCCSSAGSFKFIKFLGIPKKFCLSPTNSKKSVPYQTLKFNMKNPSLTRWRFFMKRQPS